VLVLPPVAVPPLGTPPLRSPPVAGAPRSPSCRPEHPRQGHWAVPGRKRRANRRHEQRKGCPNVALLATSYRYREASGMGHGQPLCSRPANGAPIARQLRRVNTSRPHQGNALRLGQEEDDRLMGSMHVGAVLPRRKGLAVPPSPRRCRPSPPWCPGRSPAGSRDDAALALPPLGSQCDDY